MSPQQIMLGGRTLLDDDAVVGRAAGRLAGLDDERAVGGQDALAARQRARDELGRRQVAVHRAVAGEPELGELARGSRRLRVKRSS